MADGGQAFTPQTLSAPRRVIRREQTLGRQLPYARHVSEAIIALDTRAMMMSFRLDGLSFETADRRQLNDWHGKLNNAWRNLADDRLAIWTHLVRRLDDDYPAGRFRSVFASRLDQAYRERISRTRLFINELYVTLVLHPGLGAGERLASFLSRMHQARKSRDRGGSGGRRSAQGEGEGSRAILGPLPRRAARPL